MPIDRFTQEEFENALPKSKSTSAPLWKYVGSVSGELEYIIPISRKDKDLIRIKIRSSINPTTRTAANSGEDSIRMWLEGGDSFVTSNGFKETYESLGKLKGRWVTRVSGWDVRLIKGLRELYSLGRAINRCDECENWKQLRTVKKDGANKGRVFMLCPGCERAVGNKYFQWITERVK